MPRLSPRGALAALALVVALPAAARAQLDPNAFTSLGTLNVTSGSVNYQSNGTLLVGSTTYTPVIVSQSNGPNIAVFTFDSITIGAGVAVVLDNGPRSDAVAFLSKGNISVSPVMSVNPRILSSTQHFPGPGGYRGAIGALPPVAGSGPGGGPIYTQTNSATMTGGGYGGRGGVDSFNLGLLGGESYGSIFTTLQGGSGGAAVSSALGGSGAGGLELTAVGTLTVGTITADGGAGVDNGPGAQGGGGAGGGIRLSGSSITLNGTLSAAGGNGAAGVGQGAAGGGGGRIGLSGLSTYTLGSAVAGTVLDGGTTAGVFASTAFGYAGVVSVDAQSTVVPTGRSVVLNGQPIISVSGSNTRTAATVEAYVRRDLTIDAGGTATLGMDNALRRLVSGANATALTVNGTFNTAGYNQTVDRLSGSGTINLDAGSTLNVVSLVGGQTFSGSAQGAGKLAFNALATPATVTKVTGSLTHTGGTVVQGFGLQLGDNGTVGSITTDFQLTGTAPLTFRQANSLTVPGAITGSGSVVVAGGGNVQLSGANTYTGTTTVNAGTLQAGSNGAFAPASGVTLLNASGATLDVNGKSAAVGSLAGGGATGGTVALNGGTLTAGGDQTSQTFSGSFAAMAGNLVKVGSGTQTLSGTNAYTGTTTVSGGTLAFASPLPAGGGQVVVQGGAALQAGAAVSRRVAGAAGSTIEATANGASFGDAGSFAGFHSDGELRVGSFGVTLNDANQAEVGVITTLSGGTLSAPNGLYADFGRGITGNGAVTVGGTVTKALINNGTVSGDSPAQPITINGYAKGVGTFDNVTFNGTYSPGLSPALVNEGSVSFGPANTLVMELGGTQRGGQYDALVSSGNLGFGGTLEVDLIGGYQPQAGAVFDLFDWQTESGTFSALNLPTLTNGLSWDTSNLYGNGTLSISPVPEPSTLALVGMAAAGAAWRWRRRAVPAQTASQLVR